MVQPPRRGLSRRGPAGRAAPVDRVVPVDLGTAELVPDPDRPAGWTLYIDGVPQSYVDLDDPAHLDFEYLRRIAAVIDAAAPAGTPLRALHLGGGALALPRYVAATRPGSSQRVIERDAKLIALIRRALPLPKNLDLRVRTADARDAVEAMSPGRFDLVVGDVYRGAQMPARVASVEFAEHIRRVLRPDGLYAVNVADLPPLTYSRVQAATLRAVFAEVCVIAEPGLLRGRRYGNVVLVAAAQEDRLPLSALTVAALRDVFPGRVLHGEAVDRFVSGARPAMDRNASDSPAPPPSLLR